MNLLSAFLVFSILFYSGISPGESQNGGVISGSKNYTFRFIDLPPDFHMSVQITRKTEEQTLISIPCLNITEQPVTNTSDLPVQNCQTVEILSSADITVHGIVTWQKDITAGFLALPHDQLGTEYVIDCYPLTQDSPQVAISAILHDTTINITCVSACLFEGKNVSNSIFLQAGESGILTNLKNNTEMSGTYIRSDEPISVLVGAIGVYIPKVVDGLHGVILEQLLPVSSWGKVHIVPSFQKLPDSWIIRIMAMNSNTTKRLQNCGNEESNPIIILNSTSFKDIMVNGSASGFLCIVTADQTIQVMQYVASSSDQQLGDPSMTIVPPLKDLMHGNTSIRVSWKDDQFKDYADIIVLELNGSTLLDRPWSCVNVTSPASEGSESAKEYGEFCHYWMELLREYKFTHTNRSAKFWVRLYTLHNSPGAAMMADIAPQENEGASSWSKNYTFRFIVLPAGFHTIVQITRKTEQPTLISIPCLNITEQPVTNTSDLPVQNCQTVEIFSTADITVHGIVHWRKNAPPQGITAGFLALPHDQLGTEYLIDCYTPTRGKAQVAISAILNDTTINITCKSACIFKGSNFSNSIVLQAGESGILETLKNTSEMSGTHIRSDKQISVLVGATSVYIPKSGGDAQGAQGVILEQLLPVSSWGKNHIVPPFRESPDGWIIRIMAINPGTNIWLQKCGNEESNSRPRPIIQNRTVFKDIMVSGSDNEFLCVVTADQPIQVMQYVASSSKHRLGDPSMTIIPPLKDYHGNTTIRVNEKGDGFKDYADVIVSEQGKEFLQVNGSTLLDRPWSCVNVTSPASEGSEFTTKYHGEFCHYWMELQSGEYKFTHTNRSAKFWVRLYTLHNSLGAAMMADIAPEATLPVDETTKTRESEEELKRKVTELENEFPGDFPSYKVAKEVLNNFTLFLGDRGKLGSVNETDIAFEYFYDVLIRRPLSNATADEAMSFLNKTSEALQVLYSEKTKGHLTKACEDGKNLSSSGEDVQEKLEELLTNASALIVGGGVSSFEVSRENAAFNISSTNNSLTSDKASMQAECEGDIQIGGFDVTIPCEVVQEMGSPAVYQMTLPYGGDVIASTKCGGEKKLGSHLYSIGLVSNQPQRNFSENVSLSFVTRSLEVDFLENNTLCAFWSYEDSNWSTSGCTLGSLDVTEGETRVTCLCNHLTSFAVLLDISPGEIDEVNKKILDQLTWIGCCFSIVACFLTCFGYAILRLRSDRILVHGNLALAVGLAETAFLCLDAIPEPSEKPTRCIVLAGFIYYHFMAMFAWMAIEGIHLYLMIFVVWNAEKRKIKWYMACGWGIPVIFAVVMVVLFAVNKEFAFDEYCFLSMADKSLLFFAVPVAVVIVFNIFLTIRVIIQIVKMSDGPTMKSDIKTRAKYGVKAMAVLLPIMGLTWIVGFLALQEAKLVFTYTFVVLNSLQGVFIFFIHFFRNSEVRKAFQRQRQRWAASTTWNGESSSSKNTKRKSSSSGAGKNLEPPMQTVTLSNVSGTKTKIF